MTDEGLANLVEKMLLAHGDVLGRTTRAALRSVIRRLRRSKGGPEEL
jgi:hypothetical protein